MKIVINQCYGGFGLSYVGTMEYAKRKGLKLYVYKYSKGSTSRVEQWDGEGEEPYCLYYSLRPAIRGKLDVDAIVSDRDIPRDDPDLVAVVEALGDKASGQVSKLSVVDAPDNIHYWEISERDGKEHVSFG